MLWVIMVSWPHCVCHTLSYGLRAWTERPDPMAWIISDVGRLYKGTFSISMESLCFFQVDPETPWPKIFMDSAMAAKWHDRWRFHPYCGQYKWSSAQLGQLWAMILAFDSTVLGQELEMVPGFLISHQSCAWNSHGSATAVCRVRTVRRLFLRVDPLFCGWLGLLCM